jgi:hypothetical protein
MDAKELSLLTICKGGVPEAFAIEMAKVIANWADPTIPATKPRKIIMEFTIIPFPDRSGATTTMTKCKAQLAELDTSALTGTVFLAKRDGKYAAFTRDLRQEELLFDADQSQPPVDGKTEAAGGA